MRTRAALIGAYQTAAAANVDAPPSVTWLCTDAQVGRSTFYTHFASVEELAMATVTAGFEKLSLGDVGRRMARTDERRRIAADGLAEMFALLQQSKGVLEFAIRTGSRSAVHDLFAREFAKYIHGTVAVEFPHLTPAQVDIATEYVSAGTAHVALTWLESDFSATQSDLIGLLLDLLPARLTANERAEAE